MVYAVLYLRGRKMALVPKEHTPGWLWQLGDRLWDLFQRFMNIGNDIIGTPVIGPALGVPFFFVAEIFYRASWAPKNADVLLWKAARWIDILVFEGGIVQIVEDVFLYIRDFLDDPVYFIVHAIGREIGLEGGILDYPRMWPDEIMGWIFRDWRGFKADPGAWVLVRIMEWNLDAYNWITNPWQMLLWEGGQVLDIPEINRMHLEEWPEILLLRQWDGFRQFIDRWDEWFLDRVYIYFPHLVTFIRAPLQWLQNTMYYNYGVPWSFWVNWPYNAVEHIIDVLEDAFIYNLRGIERTLSKMLRYVLEGVYRE